MALESLRRYLSDPKHVASEAAPEVFQVWYQPPCDAPNKHIGSQNLLATLHDCCHGPRPKMYVSAALFWAKPAPLAWGVFRIKDPWMGGVLISTALQSGKKSFLWQEPA